MTATTAHATPIGNAVANALQQGPNNGYRGVTWDDTSDNQLPAGWLVQTPDHRLDPNNGQISNVSHWGAAYAQYQEPTTCVPTSSNTATCDPSFALAKCTVGNNAACTSGGPCVALDATVSAPGTNPYGLCAGQSDPALLDPIWNLVTSAQSSVDFVSLAPPNGRFLATMRNAIAFLSASHRNVTVRILYSDWPGARGESQRDPQDLVAELTRGLTAQSTVTVYAAEIAMAKHSWNHAKIIAVDGRDALVGGHNPWQGDYLDTRPVHDLSIRVQGGAARNAQQFANALWTWACTPKNRTYNMRVMVWGSWVRSWQGGAAGTNCPAAVTFGNGQGPGNTRVISVGRLADVDPNAQQADVAILAMLDAAQQRIRIAQQNVGELAVGGLSGTVMRQYQGNWGSQIYGALARAIGRGVDVQILVSNPQVIVGADHESYDGTPPRDIAMKIRDLLAQPLQARLGHYPSDGELDRELRAHLSVAQLRWGPWDTFPNDWRMPGNHSKFVMADDQAFYVGSENLYSFGALSEYGFIVDDANVAGQILAAYWTPMWTASYRSATGGQSFERW